MVEVSEASVRYQAITKMCQLAFEVAAEKNLTKPSVQEKIRLGSKIRLWLKALDTEAYLTQAQRQRLVYCLIQIASINDFPSAPAIGDVSRPNILIGQNITIINNNTFSGGTAFSNTDVDTGTEVCDTFAVGAGTGAVWMYTISKSTNQVSGLAIGSWLSSGVSSTFTAGISAPILGTLGITLSMDINSGNVRLLATATSDNWSVTGSRFLIP